MKITALLVLKCSTDGSDPVILANASDVGLFAYSERSTVKQFIVSVARNVAKVSPPGQRHSLKHEDGYMVHVYNWYGLCAPGIMDDHHPARSAFSISIRMLNRRWLLSILDEYQKNFGESWRITRLDNTQPWPYLNEALAKFQDPEEADSLLKIKRNSDETSNILQSLSADELRKLLSDKSAYHQFLLSLDQVKNPIRHDLCQGTLELARHNLENEQRIIELKNQCRIIRTTELAASQEKLNELMRQEEEILRPCSAASLLQRLQEAMNKTEEESETLHRQLLDKELDLAAFVHKYKKLRTTYHKQSLISRAAKKGPFVLFAD